VPEEVNRCCQIREKARMVSALCATVLLCSLRENFQSLNEVRIYPAMFISQESLSLFVLQHIIFLAASTCAPLAFALRSCHKPSFSLLQKLYASL